MVAESVVPSYDTMIWPTILALRELGDSGSNDEIDRRASRLMGLSDSQVAILHKDGPKTEVSYRMAWARTYLSKVGAISASRRGIWALTEAGQSLDEQQAKTIPTRVRALYAKDRPAMPVVVPPADDPPDELELDWRERLLSILRTLEPSAFERLCQRILRESGFTKVEVTGRAGDGGIDGVGVLRVNLLSFQVFFQCKRYTDTVGPGAIRDFRGAMVGRTDKGLFLTTGSFTPAATQEATRDGAPALDLVDGDALCDLLKGLNLGVKTEMVESASIDTNWFADF